jgi:hypothetical protein
MYCMVSRMAYAVSQVKGFDEFVDSIQIGARLTFRMSSN